MARFFVFDALFFLLPFAAYGLWLLVTRRSVGGVAEWEVRTVTYLSLAGAVLMIASILFFIHYDRDPPGGTYVPAHMEDGRIVPGRIVPPGETVP
jgi:hypothetical protein